MESNQPTIDDFKDMISSLEKRNKELEGKKFLIYSEAAYDYLEKEHGDNCGWDRNKVIVLRGYPKFDVL